VTDAMAPVEIDLHWHGPLAWPGIDPTCPLTSLDKTDAATSSGIYLWTLEYLEGYLIYCAGITRRRFVHRFREHRRNYKQGVYTLFDLPALQRGVRQEIWHGFYFSENRPPAKIAEFNARKAELLAAVHEQLSTYRIFVAPTMPDQRILNRIEAAIMKNLYAVSGPVSEIPDRGMQLSSRWRREQKILVRNHSALLIHSLPAEMVV
jgi:predicted DNA-binding transcriptional regulator